MTDTTTLNVVSGGKIVDAILVPASAVISTDGKSASWDETTFDAPSGSTFAEIQGGVIGYGWDGKTLTPPPPIVLTKAELVTYAQGAWSSLLARGQTFNVASSGPAVPVLCDGTNDTRADLSLLALFGQASPSGSKTWLDNDGVASTLTGAQLVTLATLAGNWIADTYPALATLLGEIAAGTVTTAAAIDAYAWPAS